MTVSAAFARGSVPGTPPSGTGTIEEAQVRAMFDRIAGLYDRMNTVMTAGLHHEWRRRAAELAALAAGDRALDVATGTGDLALELARRVIPGGSVVGADFSERMLELARAKTTGRSLGPDRVEVRFEPANALALPYADGAFDAATVGFGARNFSDLELGIREMVRVVRPGGRVVVLELTTPRRQPLSTFFELWFDRLVPALGQLVGDAQAYSYLPNSVRRFPGPNELAAVMWRCGLSKIRYVLTAGGIIALHVGEVRTPSERAGKPAARATSSHAGVEGLVEER
jgi:demethylmenaquinone methyltransferase / 2-methoxy-6-polyprenyl-1,4-benzoquinol methylase